MRARACSITPSAMATPAAPIQKRYTAGSCMLDVVLQTSALSQWYPQPVVQNLHFQLWLQTVVQSEAATLKNTPRKLIAEGDRDALQAISQYLSQTVQSELAIAHLSQSAPPPPTQPPALQLLTQTLSYLQLCDLAAVLYQCEQAIQLRPVAIATTTEVIPKQTVQPPNNNLDNRNINRPRTSNSIISLAAFRQRPKLWASSAAAALLAVAVGLTTATWRQSDQDSWQISATAPTELEQQMPASADIAPETTSEATSEATLESADGDVPTRTSEAEQGVLLPKPQETTRPDIVEELAPIELPERQRETSTSPEKIAVSNDADTQPVVPRTDEPKIAAAPAPQTPALERNVATANDLDTSASERSQTSEESQLSTRSQPEVQNEPPSFEAADTPLETVAEASPSLEPNVLDAESSDSELQSARVSLPDSRTRQDSRAPSNADTGALVGAASSVGQVVTQARPYFQSKWNGAGVETAAALSYTMRVSESGEVASFEAVGEAAQRYRDRLQPDGLVIDISQEGLVAITDLTFQVTIAPNGQVRVTQTP